MLEIQRDKFELRLRMHKAGATDAEINQRLNGDHRPFRPAFVNGERIVRDCFETRMSSGSGDGRARGV